MARRGATRDGGARGSARLGATALALSGLTLLAFARVLPDLAHAVVREARDPLLVLTVLEWGRQTLPWDFAAFWNPPFFFPLRLALALSDHLTGLVPLYAALRALGAPAALAYNALLLASFPVAGLSVAYVLRRAGRGAVAAALAGAAFAFSPWRLAQLNHLQMLWIPGMALAIWSLDRLLARPDARRAALFLGAYALAVSGGSYLAYQVHLPLAAVALVRLARTRRRLVARRRWTLLVGVALLAGGLALALFWPYVEARRTLGLERPAREIETYGARPAGWLTPAPRTLLARLVPDDWPRHEQSLFPGLALVAGAALGAAAFARGRAPRPSCFERALFVSGAAALALMHAPVYLAAARLLPGLDGMRVPTRFALFVALALAALAARGFDRLCAVRSPARRRAGLAVAAALLLVETWPLAIPASERIAAPREAAEPPYVAFLAAHGEVRATAVLPAGRDVPETYRMFAATRHRRPIANGYSGYAPQPLRRLVRRCRYPEARVDAVCIALLRELGVSHLVVEDRLYRGAIGAEALGPRFGSLVTSEVAPELRIVFSDAEALVMEIEPLPGTP